MKTRRIVPSLLMVASLMLGGYVFWQFQSQLSVPAGAQREAAVIGSDSDYEAQAHWRNPTPVEHKEAANTILSQLNDFKSGNFADALNYQSRESMGKLTVKQMHDMILEDYPAFASFKSVKLTYGQCDPLGQHLQILVALTAPDGSVVEAVYFLVWEGGGFRIIGVEGARPELNMFSRFSPIPAAPPRASSGAAHRR